MRNLISGIHHVTALAGDPQKNLDFYAGVLGMRLVKKTVNFDAPDIYHFYYGDETGLPGSILTFFPYGDFPRGRPGTGMLNTISFSVPLASRSFWEERLAQFAAAREPVRDRFKGEIVLPFHDHDGLGLELVFNDRDARPGWSCGAIALENSIRGFFGVEIWADGHQTAALLSDRLDHHLIGQSGSRRRLAATDIPGNYVDVVHAPESARGRQGRGTVHHIAYCTRDRESQAEVRSDLGEVVSPTPIIDRQYFTSVYFHEPGGVLFEVATVGPGFAVDEPKEHLGESLKLPDRYEPARREIESALPPVSLAVGSCR